MDNFKLNYAKNGWYQNSQSTVSDKRMIKFISSMWSSQYSSVYQIANRFKPKIVAYNYGIALHCESSHFKFVETSDYCTS